VSVRGKCAWGLLAENHQAPTVDSTKALSARTAGQKRGCGTGKEPEVPRRCVLSPGEVALPDTRRSCAGEGAQRWGGQAISAEFCILARGA